jgi:hypothetical protein
MGPSGDGAKHFQVHLSGQLAKKCHNIQRQASEEGRGQVVVAAFRQIVERLKNDPMDFGEPLYRLPALRIQVRQGGIMPLFVDFGVCEDRPLVFIRGITLFPAQQN